MIDLASWTVEETTSRICLSCLIAEADTITGVVTDVDHVVTANFVAKNVVVSSVMVVDEADCDAHAIGTMLLGPIQDK